MAEAELQAIIGRWAATMAASRVEYDRGFVLDAVAERRSVLVGGASAEQIAAAEARLGTTLPPSYIALLQTSNGAHAGAFLELTGSALALTAGTHPPRGILPIEEVRWTRHSLGRTSLNSFFDEPVAFGTGRSPMFDGWSDEDAVRDVVDPGPEGAQEGTLLYALHIGDELYLDPMTVDGQGEWQVIELGTHAYFGRHESFAAFLADATERARDALASGGPAFEGGPTLFEVCHGTDLGTMTAQLLGALGVPSPSWRRRHILTHLIALDERDGGERAALGVKHVLGDPSADDVGVVKLLSLLGPTEVRLPSLGEVVRLERPGDGRDLDELGPDAIGALRDEIGAERVGPQLRRLALAPFASPAAVVLAELASAGILDRTVDDIPDGPVAGRPTAAEIIAAAAQLRLAPDHVFRALCWGGHRADALDHAHASARPHETDVYGWIAELDDPPAWAALDDAPCDLPHGADALVFAARTRSPLLVPRALVTLADPGHPARPWAPLALEIQDTDDAAEALRARSDLGDLWAVRALGRRGDRAAVAPATDLLASGDPDLRLVGARALRDVRDPATAPLLLTALGSSPRTATLDLVLAQALVALRADGAADALRRAGASSTDAQVAARLERWADQLS